MKVTLATAFASLLLLFSSAGCGSGSSFQDSLRFGTGLGGNGFDLVGEASSFSVTTLGTTGQIYFRLESAQDMAGRPVRLYVNYAQGGTIYQPYDFLNPQTYGHIFLSGFRVTDVGSYIVQANLVEQVGPDIGHDVHIIDAPLTMVQ
jgi:hypothetical protein